jgi:prepilin-type N-terminal cleavage/methylation domain-containing protein
MKRFKKSKGFTLVEIMIVVLIIGILLAIAVPNFIKSRETSRQKTCIGNLKQMDSGKEQFAMETNKTTGDAVGWGDLVPTYIKAQPSCPSGGTYTVNVVGTNPACSQAALGHVLP